MAGTVERLARRAAAISENESGVWSSADPVLLLLQIMAGRRRRRACACRKLRPCSSDCMSVFVDDVAEPVSAAAVPAVCRPCC